jgi:protein-S-isoprenylcysteine O-methyltransferase Ste14
LPLSGDRTGDSGGGAHFGAEFVNSVPQQVGGGIMPIIPAFEIGLWNAWIFMLLILLPLPLVALVRRGVFQTTASIRASVLSRAEQTIAIFSDVMFLVLVIYSIFLPLQFGTIWFAIGLPVYLLGLILQTIAYVNVATSPVDEPVTKGLYRYSRHPMYVVLPATLIGTGLASVSWPFLLLSVIVVVTHFYSAVLEERECLEAYGNAYREYMNRTPRWIGIPRSK